MGHGRAGRKWRRGSEYSFLRELDPVREVTLLPSGKQRRECKECGRPIGRALTYRFDSDRHVWHDAPERRRMDVRMRT